MHCDNCPMVVSEMIPHWEVKLVHPNRVQEEFNVYCSLKCLIAGTQKVVVQRMMQAVLKE